MNKLLQKIDTSIERFLPVQIRKILFTTSFLSIFLLIILPSKIEFNDIDLMTGEEFFRTPDPKYSIPMTELNIDNFFVEENNQLSMISLPKPKPKPKSKPNISPSAPSKSTPVVPPLEEKTVISNKNIKLKLKDVDPELLNKACAIVPPNGFFTSQEWKKLDNKSRQEYVDAFIIKNWKAVHEEYLVTGVNPLFILVKGIDETNYGTSKLYAKSKNWGGIKYTDSTRELNGKLFRKNSYVHAYDDCGSKECQFFKFDSEWEGRRAFTLFVRKNRYTKHLKYKTDISKNSITDWDTALYKGKYSTANNKGKFVGMAKEVLVIAKKLGLPIYLNEYAI